MMDGVSLAQPIDPRPRRLSRRRVSRGLAALFGGFFLIAGSGIGAGPSVGAPAEAGAALAVAQGAATPVAGVDPCPDELTGAGSEPWIRAELYFGTSRRDGPPFTEEEWFAFLDAEVTPRFPAGLTVLTGVGQFLNSRGDIIQERSQVLIILFPAEGAAGSSALLEEIRDAYEEQFQQESVLRADAAPVCTSF